MIEYGGNAMMYYTGAPQNTIRAKLEDMKVSEFKRLMSNAGIPLAHCIVHAPYLINLANTKKPNVFHFGMNLLKSELERSEAMGAGCFVIHPGSTVGGDRTKSIQQIIYGLNQVLTPDLNIKIALEIMAGKGGQIGKNFEELKQIINGVKYQDKIGVCLDTCHTFDAGYDIKNNLEQVINDFDRIVGLDKLFVMHINDSKNPFFSKADRHENIGYGHIGFDSMLAILYHPKLNNVIKILETPWNNGHPPYKEEIKMIKNKKFNNPFKNIK